MKNVWSKPTVSFTQAWPNGTGNTSRHIWHVVLQGKRVIATTQSGPGATTTPPLTSMISSTGAQS